MANREQVEEAKQFVEYWKDKGYEKGESQKYWLSLLRNVYGIEKPEKYIIFEDQVHLDHTSFIDGYIPTTHVLIEQKGINKDLRKPIKQSDGTLLSPFQQAKRYSSELPYSQRPRWIVTCNFSSFLVYDMENPTGEPEEILLKDLPKEYYRLQFLVDEGKEHLKREMQVSIQAGEIVGKLYDEILKLYIDPSKEETLKSLNMLCVRLVFCLYAEDAGIFGKQKMFYDYLSRFEVRDLRKALIELFTVLDTKLEDRDPYMDKELADFPYVNGGLFAKQNIEIPQLNEKVKQMLLEKASEDFDWSEISPTIFGAVFESTLNPQTRRSGGMHYTSIENIHKVIDPLFLDNLKEELQEIKEITALKTRKSKLEEYQKKLSSLTFLDPACGSGNFLTETYISLRKLENEVIETLNKGQISLGDENNSPIQISIKQFYGIEINDFAVTVAKTALWIAESQMMKETEQILHTNLEFLPLKSYANIIEGNSLMINWQEVIPKEKLSYIMGNPPFIGARLMNETQKSDIVNVFENIKNVGNLDYVSGWYIKATNFIKNTNIEVAFVSTNSICQGEQTVILWKLLFEKGININFAYKTFKWNSEATEKAAVHCIIVGFSYFNRNEKLIYMNDNSFKKVNNINGYLIEAPNIFIENRTNPICDVPPIGIGNKPIDDGNYLFTEDEMQEFIKKEPLSKKYFRPWVGSQEFINNKKRYCLWIGECQPSELRKMPEVIKRIQKVKEFRLASKSEGTRKIAEKPTRFHVENMPKDTYIIIPETSSENRKYIPMGFLTPEYICSNAVRVMPNATLYHFGILTSNVHMAWMRTVCGRLKSDYRYSKDIVYNNFIWCNPTKEQKSKIEKTAQKILDVRKMYKDSSLADLYDELTMPLDLRKAHQENDKAVMEAYGFPVKNTFTESMCVAELMKLYQSYNS